MSWTTVKQHLQPVNFVSRSSVHEKIRGKTVAIVGSGPGVLDNEPGFIDGHDIVVRVNNYRTSKATGFRTDIFYSFFGVSIKKTRQELKRDGVWLCMCKCPDENAIHSPWHIARGKKNGTDFRYIYRNRGGWWFCDTYVPAVQVFRDKFQLLGGHVPTTGFSAILDILEMEPKSVYLTGFDFFRSGVHNVYQTWVHRNEDDPIGHVPEKEREWLAGNIGKYPVTVDPMLDAILNPESRPMPISAGDFKAKVTAVAGGGALRRSAVNIGDGAGIIERVLKAGKYKRVVEIGTLLGVTAAWMAHFCDHITAVDLRRGQLERVYGEFDRREFWRKLGVHNIDLKTVRNEHEKKRFIDGLDFDFAFVDGDHAAPAPENDFNMVKRCGSVLFHDYGGDNGVTPFVNTLPKDQVTVMDIFALWQANG